MPEDNCDAIAANALGRIYGYNPRAAIQLIRTLGSPSAVIDRIPDSELEKSRRELETLYGLGCRYIPFGNELYPQRLAECPDAPAGLYVRGDANLAEVFSPKRPAIAVVGTRDLSSYGMEWTGKIVAALSQNKIKPTIVSGLALGVDGCAHQQALDSGIPTIAVLPCSIADIYPSRHIALARRISASPLCALVSDFPLGTAPMAATFVRRNRIIAGLSDATILTESRIKGGGMITAGLAFDYSRDVYALQGRIDDIRSQGCNMLIRKKMAEPIVSISDLCVSLGMGYTGRRNKRTLEQELESKYKNAMAPQEYEILEKCALTIKEIRGINIDDICYRLKLSYAAAMKYVGLLESDGIVAMDLAQNCNIIAKIE